MVSDNPKAFFTYNYTHMQYGGPDGEIGSSLRYLSQRYTIPCKQLTSVLTAVGNEGHSQSYWHTPRHKTSLV